MGFREVLFDIPFMTMPRSHIMAAMEKEDFPAFDELLHSCAELARVEYVMAHLSQSWYIPQLGGQEGEWELRTKVLTKVAAISKKEWKKEEKEYEDG